MIDILILDIQGILRKARNKAYNSINLAMVEAYWLVGKRIIEEDQQGELRAVYGASLLKNLSAQLKKEFGKGFSERNLEQMRLFYLAYPISQTVSAKSHTPEFKLSWSHYLMLLPIKDPNEKQFYEIEAEQGNWSLRELKRQYDSGLYMRLALSTDKGGIKALAEKGHSINYPSDAIKDPYILEFLKLEEQHQYSENDLESALIDKLEGFLLELGKGFTFVARQKRITFDEKHFRVDLVFYNRILRCFVV